MADQPQSLATDVRILQTDAVTTASLLAGIAETQKETARALEALRLSQFPPFTDVMRTAAVVIAIFGSALTALLWLTDARISEKTKLIDYRLAQIEAHIEVAASWKNTTVVEKIQR